MKVKDIVTEDYVTLQIDDTLEQILKKFVKGKVDSAPVFDDGEFVGVVCYKSILKYFKPKKFLFMWKKGEKRKLDGKVGKIPASKLVYRHPLVLHPETDLESVLGKIINHQICPIVMDKKKFVGMVTSNDVINFFLRDLAKEELSENGDLGQKTNRKKIETDLDKIVNMVEEREKVSVKTISKELGITEKTVERLAESLDRHHLIKLKYTFFKGAQLMRLDHEKG